MTEKVAMPYTEHFEHVMRTMSGRGVLLSVWKDQNHQKANAMAIGWGLIGSVWGRPIWQVVVRPSRYTYELMQRDRFFSVNVLPEGHDKALQLCGSASGRNRDKLAESNLTASPGESGGPIINESIIHYECQILHANDFMPEAMVPDIRAGCYPAGDYHRVFWGQILTAKVDSAWKAE